MRREARALGELERDLRGALAADRLRLVYQPMVRIADGAVWGAEALLRWDHPALGILAPGAFLDVAERSGLLVPIGEWVLRQACAEAMRWEGAAAPPVVTVNVSARQLAAGLADAVARALDASGLPAERLGLEITEDVLLRDEREAHAVLDALAGRGVRLLLDDFGTGFSSLRHLKHFPIGAVKIDRGFVEGLGEAGGDDEAIVAAVMGMASATGAAVIAEGIATAAQAERLTAAGCRWGQGYLYAAPVTPGDLRRALAAAPGAPAGPPPGRSPGG